MEYFGRPPIPPLDTFIERIWYCSDAASQARERVLPGGGTMDLVVNLVEDDIRIYDATDPQFVRAHAGAMVSGASTRSFLVDPRQRASVVGVHFRPGGAFPFLGVSPSELVDAHVRLEDVWGSGGRDLREQLLEADSTSERFRLLEAALLRRLRRARPSHPATRAALEAFRIHHNDVRIADLAMEMGLSRRRFIEVFEREVGLTPKLYARLRRFHHVKERIATLGTPPSWAEFALACRYFDQSHMIRDFVEFSGMTPASYFQGRASEAMFDHLVHVYPGPPPASAPR
jgi:AraC-like DNA-binding protein